MGFEITDDDAIWMAVGTAAEAVMSWGLRKTTALPDGTAQYPSIASTAIIAAPAIMLAYTGMSDASRGMDRKLAAFLFGVGTSNVISFVLPRLLGAHSGATPTVVRAPAVGMMRRIR